MATSSEVLRKFISRAHLLGPLSVRWEGLIFRSTTPRYANTNDLVSGIGSGLNGGRWNPIGLNAVYGSDSLETALAESLAYFRYFRIPEHESTPRVFVAIECNLQAVIDLTLPSNREQLGLLGARLGIDWRAKLQKGRVPLTQSLGQMVAAHQIEAIRVPSFARHGRTNLVVFPKNLRKGSKIQIVNEGQL